MDNAQNGYNSADDTGKIKKRDVSGDFPDGKFLGYFTY